MLQPTPCSQINELYEKSLALPIDGDTKDQLGRLSMAAQNQYEDRCRKLREARAEPLMPIDDAEGAK
jgi:hypothetical protein